MKIRINKNKEYQTYTGIGASGAWWAQCVGGWSHTLPDGVQVRDKIAELLYNKESGIGMNIYRYNIGAGSAHSGKGEYSQPLRATECFEKAPGEYDWNRDKNAVYMMKKAVENGAEEVIFFVNSPIERLTKNGMAHNKKYQIFHENISPKNYNAFAGYCLDVTEHFKNDGIPVKYLSPVNEPIWVWNGGQEGCFYRPKSVGKVFEIFADELSKRSGLGDLKLSGAESGDLRWFNKSYTHRLLKKENVRKYLDSIDVHSYFLPVPVPFNVPFLNNRRAFVKRFRRFMDKKYPGIPVVMSEWTHMQGGRDYGMDSALVMARVMQEDFTLLGASSWQHWIAVSEVDYCDGLIYINIPEKTFQMTKRYYASGNYSKYLKLGSKRIEAQSDDKDILITAFKNDDEVTLIAVNLSKDPKNIEMPDAYKLFYSITDEENNLFEGEKEGNAITLTPKSVTTIVW